MGVMKERLKKVSIYWPILACFSLALLMPTKEFQEQARIKKGDTMIQYVKTAYPPIFKSLFNLTENNFLKSDRYETFLYHFPPKEDNLPFGIPEFIRVEYKASINNLRYELDRCRFLDGGFRYESSIKDNLFWIGNNRDTLKYELDQFQCRENFNLEKALYGE